MDISVMRTGRLPVYIQLKNTILADIKNGKYPEGTALPAVNVIADAANVSVRTAYLAIQELINDGVCFKRPKKGTFVGNPANFIKHPVCAVWTTYSVDAPFQYPLSSIFYCGLLQGCTENNITPVLVGAYPEAVIKRYNRSKEFDLKGVLVLEPDKFSDAVELAKKFPDKKFFFVNYVMQKMDDIPPNMTAIVNDNYNGAYKMAEYLISLNCRDFIFMNTQLHFDDRTYHNRMRGALAALKEHSLKINKKDIFVLNRTGQSEQAFAIMIELLRSGRRPHAVFCVNDLIAAGVSRALAAEKITDIEVTGFDYLYPHIAEQWKFTTMRVQYSKMVLEALRCCNSDKNVGKIIKLQPEIKYK